MRDLINLL